MPGKKRSRPPDPRRHDPLGVGDWLRGRGVVEPPGPPGPACLGRRRPAVAAGRTDGRERRSRPKALACYGLLVRWWDRGPYHDAHEAAWLRFVDGRPISSSTTQFLDWSCTTLAAAGK